MQIVKRLSGATGASSSSHATAGLSGEIICCEAADRARYRFVERAVEAGKMRKLHAGVYTSNLRSEPEDLVRRNWATIVGHLAPGAVVALRSAFDGQPRDGDLYISRPVRAHKITLPGLTVHQINGPAAIQPPADAPPDIPYKQLFMPSQARAFLENLSDKRLQDRMLTQAELEQRLEALLRIKGPQALNHLRDDARRVAAVTGMGRQFARLDSVIGALMGTRNSRDLVSPSAVARAHGTPYDAERLELFEKVSAHLKGVTFPTVRAVAESGTPREVFAFVESYFSNYIEGTEFPVEVAEDIVFRGKVIPNRTNDSHDVLGTFQAALRDPLYSQPPREPEDLLPWLQSANATVIRTRKEVNPGHWKELPNEAGATRFVEPELVRGTLLESWQLMKQHTDPMAKALLAMFITAEVHPFTDGNGRTARLLMNAHLSAEHECRIIVPTIFRDDYVSSLKQLSHQHDASAFVRAMQLTQQWSSELPFDGGMDAVRDALRQCNAFQADPTRHRLLSPRSGARALAFGGGETPLRDSTGTDVPRKHSKPGH